MLEEAEMSQVVNAVTSSSKRPYRKGIRFLLQSVSRKLLHVKKPRIKK
jgi:hypothetical protein